jgi:prepilin-type processing-associated H-X9-DG protein
LLCLGLLAAGGHAFLVWLYGAFRGPEHCWPFRRTASVVGVVVVMFAAGMATAGVAHQVGWLLGSGERLTDGNMIVVRRIKSLHNLRQIGLAAHEYHEKHDSFPPAGTFDRSGRPLHGWLATLLPFLDRQDLYDRIDLGVPWDDARNRLPYQTPIATFLIPIVDRKEPARDGTGYALGSYAGNARVIGGDARRTVADITDGTSNTIMAGEVGAKFRPWGDPTHWRDPALGINRSPDGFGGPFPGGANLLFADGSVRFIKDTTDPRVLRAIATPDGGEAVNADSY